MTGNGSVEDALATVELLCNRYGISALADFLASCRTFAAEETLNVAVLGRFKAGKSSFLNHLLGRPLLPEGVTPVTSAVTEIQWGPREQATILFVDGRSHEAPVERIGEFIAESENPENAKQVARVRVELPTMRDYQGIHSVDTPGLESLLEHNTSAAEEWLPNVGLALVAVGVDPPLSQHDIELIRKLSRYTPHIALLLTKVDLLDESERAEVRAFVEEQLAQSWDGAVPVFPYSVRPGFEHLRAELCGSLLADALRGRSSARGNSRAQARFLARRMRGLFAGRAEVCGSCRFGPPGVAAQDPRRVVRGHPPRSATDRAACGGDDAQFF